MTKASIMIVEDELLIAQDITEILEGFDYNVIMVVNNGQDAIKVAQAQKPDIILMDIIIKGSWDGIRTAEELRTLMDVPIIYLTSHADNERLERAKITEPYGYITKPFDENTLHSTIELALYKHKTEDQKQIYKEQTVILDRSIPLTDNEKHVFYGIIRFPTLNDIELGRILKLKRSTVTAIRHKLLREKYFTESKIPDFSAIGCDLLTMIYGNLNVSKDEATKVIKEMSKYPEQIYTTITNKKFIGICVSQNFSNNKKHIDYLSTYLKSIDANSELSFTSFSIQDITLKNFFDYSRYMKKRLDIKKDYEYGELPKIARRNFSRNEKMILYALIKYPSMTDTELSSKTGIPRPSISQTRRALMKEGIVQIINIPSLDKLRSELIVLNSLSYYKEIDAEPAAHIIHHLANLSSNIFLVSDNTEMCTMNIYDDYTEYENEKTHQVDYFHKSHLLHRAEVMLLIQSIESMFINLSPLVKKVLGIDSEF